MKRTEFGQRALEARARNKLTQEEVCKALEMSQSTLQYTESRAKGSAKTAELAELYGVSARWLSTGIGSMDSSPGEPPPHISGPSFGAIPPAALAPVQSRDLPALSWAALGDLMPASTTASAVATPPPASQYAQRWITVDTDEMAPEIRRGDEIKLDRSATWRPGSVIVCADAAGIWHLRRVQDIGNGDWLAVASNSAAYAPLRSTTLTGLCRVVAVRSSREI